jgi:hypothetical protein
MHVTNAAILINSLPNFSTSINSKTLSLYSTNKWSSIGQSSTSTALPKASSLIKCPGKPPNSKMTSTSNFRLRTFSSTLTLLPYVLIYFTQHHFNCTKTAFTSVNGKTATNTATANCTFLTAVHTVEILTITLPKVKED